MSQSSKSASLVFFSYSHRDEDLRDELAKQLSVLTRQGAIEPWHDRAIIAGDEWDDEIAQRLESADIILLLISSDFLHSVYIYDNELKRAMERHEAGAARVIPIILRPCDWNGASFGKLQALPKNAKPVTLWENRDAAFLDVAQGIRRAVEELRAFNPRCQQVSAPPPPASQAPAPEQASVSLWTHGWAKHIHPGKPTAELDWTKHFCKSPWQFPDDRTLKQDLLPQLKQLHDEWSATYQTKLIDLRSRVPLTLMLAIGQQFPQVGGWQFQVEQPIPGQPVELWRSDVAPSSRRLIVHEQVGEGRQNVLIALGIINKPTTLNGCNRLMESAPGFFKSFIYAECEADDLTTNADAVGLARQAKKLMQDSDALSIHLVVSSPAAFCLFLGQQLNALGEVQIYEWQPEERRYKPTLKLST